MRYFYVSFVITKSYFFGLVKRPIFMTRMILTGGDDFKEYRVGLQMYKGKRIKKYNYAVLYSRELNRSESNNN